MGVDNVENDEVNGEENDVEHEDVEEDEHEDVEVEARSHDRNTDFARACAVEMHLDMSEESVYAEIEKFTSKRPPGHVTRCMRKFTGKRPQTKSKSNSGRELSASLRSRHAHGHLARAVLEPL